MDTSRPSAEPTPEPSPAPSQLIVVVSASVGMDGLKVFSDSAPRSDIYATEYAGTRLNVLDDADTARPKIGVVGQWIRVRASNGTPGFVRANLVEEAD